MSYLSSSSRRIDADSIIKEAWTLNTIVGRQIGKSAVSPRRSFSFEFDSRPRSVRFYNEENSELFASGGGWGGDVDERTASVSSPQLWPNEAMRRVKSSISLEQLHFVKSKCTFLKQNLSKSAGNISTAKLTTTLSEETKPFKISRADSLKDISVPSSRTEFDKLLKSVIQELANKHNDEDSDEILERFLKNKSILEPYLMRMQKFISENSKKQSLKHLVNEMQDILSKIVSIESLNAVLKTCDKELLKYLYFIIHPNENTAKEICGCIDRCCSSDGCEYWRTTIVELRKSQ